ncbi:MAG: long-chain fatty acid--CoA ligase [Limnohabitans sp.]|nr:long-chain fatty acid--CoA ligase [Limnohabitans sp.]
MRLEAHYNDRVVRCFEKRPSSLYQLLVDAQAKNPNGIALVCEEKRLTYTQLLKASSQLSGAMTSKGIVSGDRIALMLGNRIEFIVVLFAAARIGVISVPLSIRDQKPGISYALAHCGARAVFHETELSGLLPGAKEAPDLMYRISMQACAGSDEYKQWIKINHASTVAHVQEDDTAVILYTSGTTGRPKGAMLTNLSIVHSSMHYQIGMGLTTQDCSIVTVPLSHVTGLVALITTMVLSACKLIIMPQFKAAAFLKSAVEEQMTHTLMVPAMYNLCLLEKDFGKIDLSAWRVGAYGGAPMPVATIEKLAVTVPSLMLMNCYGSTETTSPATLMPQGKTANHNDTVGISLACVDMCVVDDYGIQLPHNQMGEIWIKGPMVVKGYWNNPEATAENFIAGYWRSGDLGSLDEQGYIKVLDRKKDMINRGGYKIYTIEVENALYEHPAIQECAVVAKPCEVLGERVHAFISLKSSPITDQELKTFCQSRLSDYKVPESFTFLQTPLPRNANGKLMKRLMRDEITELTTGKSK